MTPVFRPTFDALEARDVPAALSFQLADGTNGWGLFSTPDGADSGPASPALAPTGTDSAQASQSFVLADLTLTKDGVAYAVDPGATATYSNGVLVGVTATATGPDTIYLNGSTAQVGAQTAPLVLDGADTMQTFTLSDGTVGSISYEVPWDQVDSSLPSQSVAPVNFRLNVAGQNIDTGTAGANFTALPALQFQYGQGTGITFAVDTSGLVPSGFQYTSFVASFDQNWSNVIDAVKAGIGPLPRAPMAAIKPQVAFMFNIGANDTKDTVLAAGTRIRIHVTAGTNPYDFDYTTIAGQTVGNIAQQVYENMKMDWDVTLANDGRSVIVNGYWKTIQSDRPRLYYNVSSAGINYSGMNQPKGPGTVGNVQLLILNADGTWTAKPKPQ